MTVIGAIGGRNQTVYWVSSVVRKTIKENVRQFIEKLVDEVPCKVKDMLLIMDNHSSHRSYYVQDYLRFRKV